MTGTKGRSGGRRQGAGRPAKLVRFELNQDTLNKLAYVQSSPYGGSFWIPEQIFLNGLEELYKNVLEVEAIEKKTKN